MAKQHVTVDYIIRNSKFIQHLVKDLQPKFAECERLKLQELKMRNDTDQAIENLQRKERRKKIRQETTERLKRLGISFDKVKAV